MRIVAGAICFLAMVTVASSYKRIRYQVKEMQGKIVGGHDARIRDYPFMVRLIIDIGHASVGCGASYIRPIWVLTAAHCLDINDHDITKSPAVGDMRRAKALMGLEDVHSQRFQTQHSKELYINPTYFRNDTEVVNDIGLILIEQKFKLSSSVEMISIPTKFIDYGGLKVTLMGWGAMLASDDEFKATIPERLQVLTTYAHNMRDCRRRTGSPSAICIGQKGKISCSGDSGGPLIYKHYVIGVCSYGFGCSGDFAVYENVYSHRDWIDSIAGIQSTRTASKAKSRSMSLVAAPYLLLFIYIIKRCLNF